MQEKFQETVCRLQKVLEKVQEEKNDLVCKCEKLSDEMRELERKFSTKNAELHKHYDRELERQRKAFMLSEKVEAQ